MALTLGAGKEAEELRPRVEREREEGAMGTETMERVAIFALLRSRALGEGRALLDRKPRGRRGRTISLQAAPNAGLVGLTREAYFGLEKVHIDSFSFLLTI